MYPYSNQDSEGSTWPQQPRIPPVLPICRCTLKPKNSLKRYCHKGQVGDISKSSSLSTVKFLPGPTQTEFRNAEFQHHEYAMYIETSQAAEFIISMGSLRASPASLTRTRCGSLTRDSGDTNHREWSLNSQLTGPGNHESRLRTCDHCQTRMILASDGRRITGESSHWHQWLITLLIATDSSASACSCRLGYCHSDRAASHGDRAA